MKTTPAIVIMLFVVLVYHHFFNSNDKPVSFDPSGPVINNQGKWYERSQIRHVVQKHVDNKDFKQLEALIFEARTQKLQFNTMTWVLFDLYDAIANSHSDYEAIHAFIQQWRTQNPNSNISYILEARAHRAQAWEIRGNGYASRTTKDQFKDFRFYLEKSWDAIKLAEQKDPNDAELCKIQIELSFTLHRDKRSAKRYFEKCTEIEPGYIHYYFTMRTYLQKIWQGSDKELYDFIVESADETKDLYGDGLYAMLVWDHTFNTRVIFANNEGPYSWDKVKSGFEHIFKKYGRSQHILHGFGYCAMLADDHETFAKILQEIGTEWDDNKIHYFKKKAWYDYHLNKTRHLLND